MYITRVGGRWPVLYTARHLWVKGGEVWAVGGGLMVTGQWGAGPRDKCGRQFQGTIK